MQNGAFGWATSLTSSLAAQKVSWSTGVGYQASLTDLFLKKNSLPFGSGISQLAAASSYLEKMSSASDHHHHHQPDPSQPHPQHQHPAGRKCSHGHDKNKFACDQCVADFSVPGPSSKTTTSHSFSDHPHHHSSAEKSPLHQHQSPHSASTSSPHHVHHMPPPSGLGPQQSVPPPQQPPPQATTSQSCRRNSNNNNSANRAKNAPVKHFLCPVCHRTFTQKGNLKTHMMIHSGDKPYACQICGKSFTQKGNVDTHMKIHTGEKDYNCRHCSKGFTQRGNLKTHERSVHTKEKPYACDICGKCFSQKGNMMTHLRTHNKDDRFPCTLCGKTFSQKGNLKTHMQRHSGTLPARRYGPRSRQNQNVNRLNSAAARSNQFAAAASESRTSHSAPKGPSAVDDESLSSVEHSLDSSGAMHSQSSQNLLSPPVVVTEAAHSALKQATQSRDHQQQHPHQLQLPEQRNNPIAPIAVQFNSRFYSPNSAITAPLAHTATWLASGAASAVAGIASSKARQYDSFLSSYAGFAAAGQHPGQHLTRLTLLPSATHAMDHHHHAGDESAKGREGLQMQSDYGSQHQQPNPDFSQLLD